MERKISAESYFFSWEEIALQLQSVIRDVLGRELSLRVWPENCDYWGVQVEQCKLSVEEIRLLLTSANAGQEAWHETLPDEGENETGSLGMILGRSLLAKSLQATWKEERITEDGLWLIDVVCPHTRPYTCSGLLRHLDQEMLFSVQDVLNQLYEDGSTDTALSEIREIYFEFFGNELCWLYPIPDGLHLGTYILAVKEGFLSIPYNCIDPEEYEILILKDAALHNEESLGAFLSDWKGYSNDLMDAMREMYQITKEAL